MCVSLVVGGATLAKAQDAAAKVKEGMAMLKEKTLAVGAPKLDADSLYFGDVEMNGNFDILGSQYEAGYEPIKDSSDAVIGVFYAGFKL